MADDIKVGVIGTSLISDSCHIPSVNSHKHGRVTAICGRNEERANEVAEKHSIPEVFTDFRQMLEKARIDAVVVASPNDLHYPMVMDALKHNLHVFCEKPLALKLEHSKEMYEKAEACGVKHMTAFTFRWVPFHKYFRELIDNEYIGKPFHCSVQLTAGSNIKLDRYKWKSDKTRSNGILGGLGSHAIDQARWLFGDIKKISATLKTFTPLPVIDGKTYDTADDSAVVSVQFKNGVHGTVYVSSVDYLGCGPSISASGDKGRLELVYSLKNGGKIVGAQMPEKEMKEIELPDQLCKGVDKTNMNFDQLLKLFENQNVGGCLFVDSIFKNETVSPTLYDGFKAQEVIEAAFQSDETGKWIELS